MRPSDTCDDPVLLAAEVRRLRAVIASGESVGAIGKADGDSAQPVTLTDAEREAIEYAAVVGRVASELDREVLRGLLERTRREHG